jgi:YfiH family protein
VHGFGTLEEPIPSIFLQKGKDIWDQVRPKWKQVHGTEAVSVKVHGQECGETDALFSKHKEIPISVVTADCVPILLAHRDGLEVAAVHAGWRGVRGRILSKLWAKLSQAGNQPEDWVAAIGPAIGPCCYEVSQELADDFRNEFSEYSESLVVPKSRTLDLPAIQHAELTKIGLKKVELIRACTKCSVSPVFHSYRREGGGVRQWSVIMRTDGQ